MQPKCIFNIYWIKLALVSYLAVFTDLRLFRQDFLLLLKKKRVQIPALNLIQIQRVFEIRTQTSLVFTQLLLSENRMLS